MKKLIKGVEAYILHKTHRFHEWFAYGCILLLTRLCVKDFSGDLHTIGFIDGVMMCVVIIPFIVDVVKYAMVVKGSLSLGLDDDFVFKGWKLTMYLDNDKAQKEGDEIVIFKDGEKRLVNNYTIECSVITSSVNRLEELGPATFAGTKGIMSIVATKHCTNENKIITLYDINERD